jgi:glycerol-3-phosphate cytidylyltransferase
MRSAQVIGYTAGVFDLFHIGHVNLLRNARDNCDFLIVAVTSDDLALKRKGRCIIPERERMSVVQSVRYVDKVILQSDFDKFGAWEKLKFDRIFVGNDWENSPEWKEYESKFASVGVSVMYFPYTTGTSSTLINEILQEIRGK